MPSPITLRFIIRRRRHDDLRRCCRCDAAMLSLQRYAAADCHAPLSDFH